MPMNSRLLLVKGFHYGNLGNSFVNYSVLIKINKNKIEKNENRL